MHKAKLYLLIKILPVALVLLSCASVSLPEFQEVPKNYDQSQMSQIKLISTLYNGSPIDFCGLYGDFWSFPFNMSPVAGIGFDQKDIDQKYIVYARHEWEKNNGAWLGWNRRFKLNDEAVFYLPAGEYSTCVFKKIDTGKLRLIKDCYNNQKIKFEAGAKYEMYITWFEPWASEKEYKHVGWSPANGDITEVTTTYRWLLRIDHIRKIDEFQRSTGFSE